MSTSQAHKQKQHKETTLNSYTKHYSPPNHFNHHSVDTKPYVPCLERYSLGSANELLRTTIIECLMA